MKTLSEFLEIPERVKFKVEFLDNTFMIQDNKLWSLGDDLMGTVNTPLNDIVGRKITILKPQILTDKEKEYLKLVTKYFKNEKIYIIKTSSKIHVLTYDKNVGVNIELANIELVKGLEFKDLKEYENYSLKELGLED